MSTQWERWCGGAVRWCRLCQNGGFTGRTVEILTRDLYLATASLDILFTFNVFTGEKDIQIVCHEFVEMEHVFIEFVRSWLD